jgi:hypothetical protein
MFFQDTASDFVKIVIVHKASFSPLGMFPMPAA